MLGLFSLEGQVTRQSKPMGRMADLTGTRSWPMCAIVNALQND